MERPRISGIIDRETGYVIMMPNLSLWGRHVAGVARSPPVDTKPILLSWWYIDICTVVLEVYTWKPRLMYWVS